MYVRMPVQHNLISTVYNYNIHIYSSTLFTGTTYSQVDLRCMPSSYYVYVYVWQFPDKIHVCSSVFVILLQDGCYIHMCVNLFCRLCVQ